MKKGFSFGEVFVAMVVIGIISALTLPIIQRTLTSQHKQLYKLAVDNLNSVIVEAINNPSLYPSGQFTTGAQFCTDFSSNINLIGTADCASMPIIPDTPNFTSSNGMRWYFADSEGYGVIGDFNASCPDSAGSDCLLLFVDVNGTKGNNTIDATDTNQRDILKIYVTQAGKIYIPESSDGPERSYMTN